MSPAVARIFRIRAAAAARRPVPPEDAAILVRAIDAAINDGKTIESGLGLAPGWRTALRRSERDEGLRRLVAVAGSNRQRARSLQIEIRRYAASGYIADRRAARRPTGRHGELFDFLAANGGDIPSDETIRKIINGLRG